MNKEKGHIIFQKNNNILCSVKIKANQGYFFGNSTWENILFKISENDDEIEKFKLGLK